MSILAANFFIVGLLVALGVLFLKVSILKAVLLLLDAIVAFPIFIKFKDIPESRKYTWRIVRLIASVVILLLIVILI